MAPRTEHRPVLLAEALCALAPQAAGHLSRRHFRPRRAQPRAAAALGPRGRVIAIDRDPQAVAAAAEITDPRFSIAPRALLGAGRRCSTRWALRAWTGCCSTWACLRRSSSRRSAGFRSASTARSTCAWTRRSGESAAQWLSHAAESEIREVIRDYGEERFAQQIAKAIVAARSEQPLRTTRQLADLVGQAVRTREAQQDPATRTFQALRIFVNQELEDLSLMLPRALERPRPGRQAGRDQLPLARGPHRQAVPRARGAAAGAARPAAARIRDACAAGETDRQAGARLGCGGGGQSALAQRDHARGRENTGRHGETEPCAARGAACLRARPDHVAAPGAEGVLELEREQARGRELDVEYGQLQLEASTWGLHARVERIAGSRSGCARPTRAACGWSSSGHRGDERDELRVRSGDRGAPAAVALALRAARPAGRVSRCWSGARSTCRRCTPTSCGEGRIALLARHRVAGDARHGSSIAMAKRSPSRPRSSRCGRYRGRRRGARAARAPGERCSAMDARELHKQACRRRARFRLPEAPDRAGDRRPGGRTAAFPASIRTANTAATTRAAKSWRT